MQVNTSQTIRVSIDWTKAPKGLAKGKISISGTGWGGATINVSALNNEPLPKDFKGFVEADGYLAIEAEHFSKSQSWSNFTWQKIPEHGRNLSSMSVYPVADTSFLDTQHAPYLEYSVYLFTTGKLTIEGIFAPTLPFTPGRGLRYAIAVNDEVPQIIDVVKDVNDAPAWEESVRSEMRKTLSTHTIEKAGQHKVRIYALDPGVTLSRLVLNTGGLLPSYLGPQESPRVK